MKDEQIRRILLLQQRQIGDALLATPAVELLASRFPQAEIHFFTEKKCFPLLQHNPHIHKFHLLDKEAQASLPAQWAWYRQVAKENFDLLVDFQQLPRCRMLTRFCGAKWRLSFPAPWYRPWLYNIQTKPQAGYAAATKVSILAPLGIGWQGEAPRIYLTDEEKGQAQNILAGCGFAPGLRLLSLDSTHRRANKRWPAASFIKVMDALAEADPSLRFLLLRGPGEEAEVAALRAGLAQPHKAYLPPEAPSLRLSAACMAQASLHLGSCSSPRHMALALGVPSLVIPGASGPEWTYPEPYAQGRHRELRPIEGQDLVQPEAVLAEAKEMLGLI